MFVLVELGLAPSRSVSRRGWEVGIAELAPFIEHGPWVIGLAVGIPAAGKIIVAAVALLGSDSKDRPDIIKAVAELFRWRRQ